MHANPSYTHVPIAMFVPGFPGPFFMAGSLLSVVICAWCLVRTLIRKGMKARARSSGYMAACSHEEDLTRRARYNGTGRDLEGGMTASPTHCNIPGLRSLYHPAEQPNCSWTSKQESFLKHVVRTLVPTAEQAEGSEVNVAPTSKELLRASRTLKERAKRNAGKLKELFGGKAEARKKTRGSTRTVADRVRGHSESEPSLVAHPPMCSPSLQTCSVVLATISHNPAVPVLYPRPHKLPLTPSRFVCTGASEPHRSWGEQ